MSLNHDLVGKPSEPVTKSWTSTETLLYALGIGYGHDDQLTGLQFTTENTDGIEQVVAPTYGVIMTHGAGPGRSLGDFDRAMLVHGEQGLRIHRRIPAAGTAQIVSTITDIFDKGSAAIVRSESTATDSETGAPLVTTTSSVFIRGEGGFGGESGPKATWQAPDREPDWSGTARTWPGQALLYRLNGDRNPLHADPAFAARGGFEKPILHGLCTYGVSARVLLDAPFAGDAGNLREFSGRFSSPVIPGDELTVRAWQSDDDEILFQTVGAQQKTVIDHGRARFGPPEA
ncbi:enoyl-CoA hydratase [Epidermidibacterium keratini]|uniref:Enoyl-CoA hydratase n=1 Tax=Epidermidibacterium keratini TaxID=1891644 RepID=A0A7L4YQC7_9ACTN|nr:MaoC family dehydratase [Epidermidibacterium keratini]QHC01278.1 enoyl-CoA hydratase [Epidermidibacterium keratini]